MPSSLPDGIATWIAASFQQFQIPLLGDILLLWVNRQESGFRIQLHHSVPKENKKVTTVTWLPMAPLQLRPQALSNLCRIPNSTLWEQDLMSSLNHTGQATTKAGGVLRAHVHHFWETSPNSRSLTPLPPSLRSLWEDAYRVDATFSGKQSWLLELHNLWTVCERNCNATSGLGDEYDN